jgi:hypothetical protein
VQPKSDEELLAIFAEARRLFTEADGGPITGATMDGDTHCRYASTVIIGAEAMLREKLRRTDLPKPHLVKPEP